MQMININNYGYKVPENWLDITISQLQDIAELQSGMEAGFDREVIETSLLTGIPEDILNEMSFKDYSKIRNALTFIDMSYPDVMKPIFTHMGVDYEIEQNIENMSTAEFIDFDTIQKAGISELHTMMAILYKPKNKEDYKYNVNDLKIRAEIFKNHMSAEYALSAMAFMVVLGQTLIASSPYYSQYVKMLESNPEMVVMTQTIKMNMQNIGDGK